MAHAGHVQAWPLVTTTLLDHAAAVHGQGARVASRSVAHPSRIRHASYATVRARSLALAKAFALKLGIESGDNVATMAFNSTEHLELWYAIMGIGAVCHTLNPRYSTDQLLYIMQHASDVCLCFDGLFFSEEEPHLLGSILPSLVGKGQLRHLVAMETSADAEPLRKAYDASAFVRSDQPFAWDATKFHDMESLAAWGSTGQPFAWFHGHDPRSLDENMPAGLCYTSGTTGRPKGVVYTHRSNVLHALTCSSGSFYGWTVNDTCLPVVPLFHANAWAYAFCAPLAGIKLIFPGRNLDGRSLVELLLLYQVTVTSGVPTVWHGVMQFLETDTGKPGLDCRHPRTREEVEQALANPSRIRLPHLTVVGSGGSALPPVLLTYFRNNARIGQGACEVYQGWGMTELSPIGTISRIHTPSVALPTPPGAPVVVDAGCEGEADESARWSEEQKTTRLLRAGTPVYTVQLRIVDPATPKGSLPKVLPWDDRAVGALEVRGAAVVRRYYGGAGETPDVVAATDSLTNDGWFPTGDLAAIDASGSVRIVDRVKDVIKSGGEWISSLDLEAAVWDMLGKSSSMLQAPSGPYRVVELAIVGVPHPRWEERPLLILVVTGGRNAAVQESDARALIASTKANLAPHVAKWWIPDSVLIWRTSLPKGATGKVDKKAVKALLAKEAAMSKL